MKIFTRLGITFLLAVIATGMLWAQPSEAEIAAKMQANGYSTDVIGGTAITDADVIAVGTPIAMEKIKNLNIPTQTTNSKGTDEIDIIGGTTNAYNAGPRSRGNAFHCTVGGKILTEFMGWHAVTINPTTMVMCVYEGDAAEGVYNLVSASDITPAPVGTGWVSSGAIDFPLVENKYYLLIATFQEACGYYAEPAVTPFPYPVAFGEAIGGAGYTWAPTSTNPPAATQTVTAGAWAEPVLYYQQIVTEDATSYDNDLGIQAIVAPSSGNDLTAAEEVTVNIKNYGVNPQSGFDVSYSVDGGTAVVETISATINGGETLEHTFATTVDLSAYGIYEFEACTDLTGDENPDNNCKTKSVESYAPAYCDASTTSEDEYIGNVLCGAIDNSSAWQGGVADYTAMFTNIGPGMSEAITVTNGGNPYASDMVYVWVDWNDNFEFEQGTNEEFMLENVGGTGVTFTGTITAPADAMAGMHRMRIRMTWSTAPVPCGIANYGEVEDYSIMVGDPTYGNLEGTVTAAGGGAIEGATISVAGLSTTSLADGTYSIMDVPTGNQDVSCTATGYNSGSGTVLIEEGMTATLDFELTMALDPPLNFEVTSDGYATWESPVATAQGLWNQMDNPGVDGGISAQDFEASFDTYDAEGADDFVIPAGETWTINQVDVLGSYSAAGPCNLGNVRIYANDAGMPGTLLFEYVAAPASPDATGNLFIEIPETELTEGTYWISVQGNMEYGVGGQWYWSRQAPPLIGSEFYWQNPGDGFGSGFTTWVTGSIQWPAQTDYDLSFALYGFLAAADGTITEYASAKRAPGTKVSTVSNYEITGKPTPFNTVTKNTDALLGYNVYLDGVFVEYTTDLFWQYTDLNPGQTYMGGVSSVWDEGESEIVEDGFTVPGGTPGAIVFEDDFEAYNAGEQVACQNPDDWTTWSNSPCGADDAYVSTDYAYSGVNSVNIITNEDLVMDLDDYLTSGKHTVTVMIYVPTGGDAYYNILSAFVPAPEWAFEVYFNAGGDAAVSAGGTAAATFNYPFDTWMESKVVIDLNADWAEYYFNGNLIIEWPWTAGASGGGNALQLGALDFFGATASTTYYFDDLVIETEAGLPAPTNLVATVIDGNDVFLTWDAPAGGGVPMALSQHDNTPNNGYFQAYDNGYGVVFDLAAYPGATLEAVDFHHASWGVTGTWDYKFHIVDWDTYTELAELGPFQTTVNDDWELDIDLGSYAGASGMVGIFLEPMSNDPADAYPDLSFDVSLEGTSFYGPLASYSGMAPAGGDFLLNLWIMTAADKQLVQAKKVSVNNLTAAPAHNAYTPFAGTELTINQKESASKGFIGYNVYRDGAVIAEDLVVTNYTDMNLLPGTYSFDVKAVYDEGISAGAGPEEATILGGVARDLVIIEVATGTWCQFCPGSAMGVDEMHEEGLSVGVIEYHGGDDYETTESAARIAYYGITGYPTAVFDGVDQVVGGNATISMYPTYLPKYENRIDIPSLFEIDAVYENTGGNNYQVSIDAEMIETYPWLTNDIVLQVVLTESHIPEAWLGQTEVNFVCRDMIPDENGTDLDFATSATQSVTLDFTIPSIFVMENLELVVFIQDNTTKEILQGHMAWFFTGVEEVIGENEIAVYPNPATDFVNINATTKIRSITVYNNVGQVVTVENVQSNLYKLNTTNFENGIYFLQLETEQGTISKRVVIE